MDHNKSVAFIKYLVPATPKIGQKFSSSYAFFLNYICPSFVYGAALAGIEEIYVKLYYIKLYDIK